MSPRKHVQRRGIKAVWLLSLCLAITFLAGVTTSSAQVTLTPVVTFNISTGVFTYSYSVMNGSSNSLAIISFGARPTGALTVQNLSSPMGFAASYDSGNGFVSFFEDNNPATPQMFAPGSTVSPFTFTSMFGPGTTTFEALDVAGNTFTGVTQAPIPEPSVLALSALALPGIAFLLYRRRKMQRTAQCLS
jgi:hypothetical protein